MGASSQAEDGSRTLHNDAVSGTTPLRLGARTNTTRDTLQAPRATCPGGGPCEVQGSGDNQ